MILLAYLLVIFICLFILFVLSRHDFVLLRQSINLRQVFDSAFIVIFISFIVARLSYIAYTQNFNLINPLRFIYLTRYWGIVPFLGLLIVCLTLSVLFRKKKNILRIFDIYFIAFSPLILLDILFQPSLGISNLIKIISILILSIFYIWFIKIHNKFNVKDGFTTALIFITYSLVSLSLSFANVGFFNIKYVWYHLVLFISLIGFSVMFVLVQRNFFKK